MFFYYIIYSNLNRFPDDEELCKQWENAIYCLNKQINSKSHSIYSRICSKHFKKEMFISSVRLLPDAVPSEFPQSDGIHL